MDVLRIRSMLSARIIARTALRHHSRSLRYRVWCCGLLLAGFAVQAQALTCTSRATGNWSAGATTWTGCGAGGPVAADTVIIQNGHAVTMNVTNAAAATVTINAGGKLLMGDGVQQISRTLTVFGNMTVSGTFQVNPLYQPGGNHTLSVGGILNTPVGGTVSLDDNPGGGNGSACDATVTGDFTNAGTFAAGGSGGNLTVTGNLINTGTFNGGTGGTLITVGGGNAGGNWTNNGVFTAGNGTVTLSGTANSNIAGTTANTFNNLIINKTAPATGVTITNATNHTVNNTLTLTSGTVTTGSNTLITAAICNLPSVSRTSGWVNGNLQKRIPAGASTCTFEVGGTSAYTPITATFIVGTLASNITAKSTDGDHASIATSGLDPSLTANRSWSFTSTAAEATAFSAVFNFVAGDLDTDTQPATRFSGRTFSSGAWATPTTGTRAATSTQLTGITLVAATQKDFVVGEAARTAGTGSFNAVENLANATTGKIFTKLAGTAFTIDLVALNPARTAIDTTFKGTVKVELLNSSSGGVLDANGCNAGWAIIQTLVTNPQFLVANAGRKQNVSFTENNAWPDVRVRVSSPATGTATLIGCSSDNFSVRPTAFTITSTNATQTDSSGTPTVKTGAGFNLTSIAVAGYNLAPSIDNTKVTVPSGLTAGVIGGVFSTAPAGTGTATGSSFFYSEVGNFGLNTNAIYDSSFTSVDSPNECTADFSNTLVGGKYGCSFGSTAVPLNVAPSGNGGTGFGRFIPDNFNVILNAPIFGATCGSFSYIGQRFNYTTAPVITVTARNGTANGNATTRNYAGPYMKITNATLTPNTTAGRYSRFDALAPPVNNTPALDTSNMPAAGSDPAIGIFTNGVGTLTFKSDTGLAGTGLAFTRSATASNLFNADIVLAVNVIDGDGVAYGSNPASFGALTTAGNGMAFSSSGKEMRYGRLRVANTYGSELLPLPVNITAQYWNGTQYLTNTADNCTSFAAANFAQMAPPTGPTITTTIQASGTLSNGAGRITLTKPTGPVGPSGVIPKGSVDVSSTIPYLSPGLTGRETFGVYKSGPVIYMREIY